MAAMKAGVRTVVLPRENLADLEELSEQVRSALRFVPVSQHGRGAGHGPAAAAVSDAADVPAHSRPLGASPAGDAPPASPFMA